LIVISFSSSAAVSGVLIELVPTQSSLSNCCFRLREHGNKAWIKRGDGDELLLLSYVTSNTRAKTGLSLERADDDENEEEEEEDPSS
jgi:hypothetical protein